MLRGLPSIFNMSLRPPDCTFLLRFAQSRTRGGMPPAPFVLRLVVGVFLLAALSGCATATDQLERKLKIGEPVSQIFFAKYEEVESALKLALMKYPQRVDNTDAGIFETDYVKGEYRFKPPHKSVEYSSGYRYRILVRLVRGKSVARPAVQVVVVKQIEIAKDFFAEPTQVASDGLEESVILYRVGRELTVSRSLQKAGEKQNKKPADS